MVRSSLLLVALLEACSGGAARAPRLPTPGRPTLSVMTYNLNYGLAGDREALDAVAEASADVVLLQETTPEWERALRARLSQRYASMAFRHCCVAGGLGILSHYALEDLAYLEPPAGGWFPACRFRLSTPMGRVEILNVHLRPQIGDSGPTLGGVVSGMVTTPPIRRRQIERYLAALDPGELTLIAGDFNESESGSALASLGRRGFRSALPEYGSQDTWHYATSFGQISRRFDHIVYGPELVPLSARVINKGRSDHWPVLAVFERR